MANTAHKPGEDALFTDYLGTAIQKQAIERRIAKHAAKLGLHDPNSNDLSKRLTPHCFRHFFTRASYIHLACWVLMKDMSTWARKMNSYAGSWS